MHAMSLALLCLLVFIQSGSFSDERHLLDRRLETLRRILPDGPTPQADVALVRQLAEEASLRQVDVLARPPADATDLGHVVVDISALGLFIEIDRFFRHAALSHRLIDVESLKLSATNHGMVKLSAVLRLPYRVREAPLPPPPDGVRAAVRGMPRGAAEAYLRDQARALGKSESIQQLRRQRRNPRLFLSEVAAVTRERPVTLTYASLGDEFLIRGLTIGEGPAHSLEKRLEEGFFRIDEFLMARDGACRRFEVRGKSPVVGIEAELPLPTEDPFRQDSEPCRIDRDVGPVQEVKGPSRKRPGEGPLTLRLLDVDLPDVLQVLHLLTGDGYIVDGDVRGRVSVELNKVTSEQALAALQNLGLSVTLAGPTRRVAPAQKATESEPVELTHAPPVASFLLKRTPTREILAVMTEARPDLAALGPEGFLGTFSVWARDVSLEDLRAAIVQAAGLSERLEDERRVLERAGDSEESLAPIVGSLGERRLVAGPADLAVSEFELAGLASDGTTWTAFAYSPRGTLLHYRQGDSLADARVTAVYSTDLTLETDEGPRRITLSEAAR